MLVSTARPLLAPDKLIVVLSSSVIGKSVTLHVLGYHGLCALLKLRPDGFSTFKALANCLYIARITVMSL